MDKAAQELIPLAVAVRILYGCLHGIQRQVGHVAERLNGFAYSLAASGAMYTIVGEYRLARRVSRKELAIGFFRNAATELHFLDGRPTLTGMAVTRKTLASAVRRLALEKQARK